MKLRIVTILVFTLSQPLPAQSVEDLRSLWQKLKANNPELQQAEQDLAQEESKVASQWGALTPSLTLRGEWSPSQNQLDGNLESSSSRSARLQLRQALVDRTAWVQLSQQQNLRTLRSRQAEKLRHDMMLRLVLTYYETQEAKLVANILEEAFQKSLNSLEAQAYQVLEAGVRSPRDVSVYLLQISQLRLRQRQVEPRVRERFRSLNLLVSSDPITDIQVPDRDFQPEIRDLPAAQVTVEQAIEDLELKARDLQVDLAASRLWPRLSLFGEWSRSTRSPALDVLQGNAPGEVRDSSLGLALEVPLWSGLSDYYQRRAAVQGRESIRFKVSGMQREREALIGDAEARLHDEYARLEEATRVWKQAKKLRDLARQRQDAGLASFDDILGPEIQLIELSITRLEASFHYLKSLAAEFHRRGLLDERQFELLETK
jgi:outer membrane protein TolC